MKLIERLRGNEFPHEIGLFLSYPPEDVKGFMADPCACKCSGCWKVYGGREAAEKQFARYRKCTGVYCEQWREGLSSGLPFRDDLHGFRLSAE